MCASHCILLIWNCQLAREGADINIRIITYPIGFREKLDLNQGRTEAGLF